MTAVFDQSFYDDKTTAESARWLLPHVVNRYDPRSALDVGCGNGVWMRELKSLGVPNVTGIDGIHSQAEPKDLVVADLRHEFPYLGRRFDLCLCLEVAEHLPVENSEPLVDNLCICSDVIIFSAAVPGQGGHGHINCQWQSYWAEKFRRRGFLPSDWLRQEIWADGRIEVFYRQNIIAYQYNPRMPYALIDDVIHPDFYRYKLETAKARGWGI